MQNRVELLRNRAGGGGKRTIFGIFWRDTIVQNMF